MLSKYRTQQCRTWAKNKNENKSESKKESQSGEGMKKKAATATATSPYNAQNEHMREDNERKKNSVYLVAIVYYKEKNSPTSWCMRVILLHSRELVCKFFFLVSQRKCSKISLRWLYAGSSHPVYKLQKKNDNTHDKRNVWMCLYFSNFGAERTYRCCEAR